MSNEGKNQTVPIVGKDKNSTLINLWKIAAFLSLTNVLKLFLESGVPLIKLSFGILGLLIIYGVIVFVNERRKIGYRMSIVLAIFALLVNLGSINQFLQKPPLILIIVIITIAIFLVAIIKISIQQFRRTFPDKRLFL